MNEIIWDKKLFAWIDKKTGYVIAPRIDSDGIDYFFVKSKDKENADARYCSGEGYWAFICLTEEEYNKFKEMANMIRQKLKEKVDDKFELKAVKYLPF
jgi:hypothetical protein